MGLKKTVLWFKQNDAPTPFGSMFIWNTILTYNINCQVLKQTEFEMKSSNCLVTSVKTQDFQKEVFKCNHLVLSETLLKILKLV